MACERGDVQRLIETLERPGAGPLERPGCGVRFGERPIDVLGLAAVVVRGNDGEAGDCRGDCGAVVAADGV